MFLNSFGKPIKPLMELREDKKLCEVAQVLLQEVLEAIGVENRAEVTKIIFSTLHKATNQKDWERQSYQLLSPLVKPEILKLHWQDRADRIVSWFKSYLKSPVFEFGCDDGILGKTIKENGFSVTLSDVFEHENIRSLDLPFYLFKERKELPISEGSFSSVVLSSVLHHCNDPVDTIRESKRLLGNDGLILVSESVYGLNEDDLRGAPGRLHTNKFAGLSADQQLGINIFFEIIYHKILNFNEREEEMINIPYNYLPAKEWPHWFEAQGLQTLKWWPIGISHKIGPLCHAIYILKKTAA